MGQTLLMLLFITYQQMQALVSVEIGNWLQERMELTLEIQLVHASMGQSYAPFEEGLRCFRIAEGCPVYQVP
jgi:hypothetical protein